jgi:hypothetical protein
MFAKFFLSLFCLALIQGSGGSLRAEKRNASDSAETTQAATTKSGSRPVRAAALPSDACALLDKSEIALVQGASVQQSQPTTYATGDLSFSQCYYVATSGDGKNLSVHLELIQANPKSAKRDAASEFWRVRFERGDRENESRERETREKRGERGGEEEEELAPLVSLRGVGNEAVWVSNGRGGVLFARKGEKVVRLSVGGSDDEKTKIEKSKRLAKQALARLK